MTKSGVRHHADDRPPPTLLVEHVERFNRGVRTGDFGDMVSCFAEDAELFFDGIPVGPLRGREAIAAAYASQPPDDEIVLLDGDGTYAWAKEPEIPAGQMFLTERDGRIARLVIRYDPSPGDRAARRSSRGAA